MLDKSHRDGIIKIIPELNKIQNLIFLFRPDILAMAFGPDSNIPIASVCLIDSVDMLCDARFAIYWALMNERELGKTNYSVNRLSKLHQVKYFCDDTALRLYSSGEHLASAIYYMLELDLLSPNLLSKKGISRSKRIAEILFKNKPKHVFTDFIKRLIESLDWQKTIKYRNAWIHDQSPRISGLGIHFKRKKRWTKMVDYNSNTTKNILHIFDSDPPDIGFSDLILTMKNSAIIQTDFLNEVTLYYKKLLESKNISFKNGKINYKF